MNNLWDVISSIGLELHPDRVGYIAKKIENITFLTELTNTSFRQGLNVNNELILQLKKAWESEPNVTPREVAIALKSASVTAYQAVENQGSIELVWSGPSTGMVPIRHTEQVLNEVIEFAQSNIFIVSFVAYEVSSVVRSLQKAIDRKVKVDILLEVSYEFGGRVTHDSIKAMKRLLPSANYYAWKETVTQTERDKLVGAVHAKCAVSDGKIAFITSANLTNAAMERNMELGVLIKEGKLPRKLNLHLEALKTTKIIREI
jgi:cardiolipin synthase A/B